jgi:hypothetical protein
MLPTRALQPPPLLTPLFDKEIMLRAKRAKISEQVFTIKMPLPQPNNRTEIEHAITNEKTVQIKMPFLPQQRHQLRHPRRSGDYPKPKALPLARSNSLREWNT